MTPNATPNFSPDLLTRVILHKSLFSQAIDIAKLFLATAGISVENCLHVKSIFDIIYANR